MEEKKLTVKDSSIAFFVGFLLCQLSIVVATCAGLIISKIFKLDISEFNLFFNTGIGYFILTLFLDLTMIGLFFYFKKGKTNHVFSKPKTNKIFIYILIAIASFLSLYPIVVCFDSLLIKLGVTPSTIPYELNTKNFIISIFSLVIFPAVCEELLFRGIIFNGLKKHGKIFSITITALMFTIFHMSISQTIYPILMGLLLTVIMYKENNIYYCIAVHLINNFLSLSLSYFGINLIFNHWTYILLAVLLVLVFISVVMYFIIKNHKTEEKQPLNKTEKILLFSSIGIMLFFWVLTAFI